MGQLMSIVSYGAQDVYLVNPNNKETFNGNPYYKKLANPNTKIHAAGNRHGRNKQKEKETRQRKAYEFDMKGLSKRRSKYTDPAREPVINTGNYLRAQRRMMQQLDANISPEQLDEELAFRLSQGYAYETKQQQLIASIKLQDLITRLPARPLENLSDGDNAQMCCISYEPILENDAYTMCARCRAVCCWQVLSTWLKNSSSCPVCRLDMSGYDIFNISYRNCPK
jgi:hypothetical protein